MEADHSVQSMTDVRVEEFRAAVPEAGRLADATFTDCRFHCARHDANLSVIARLSGEGGGNLVDDYDLSI
ncbi:MAG TPA: hypothetical protein VGR06_37720 [Actinophytocola sp.]|jgi:hypothetical protein|uniref:hypothetical protein n=1 Tax=Actinophytocola sp. TaxID=1872138 RepID=UPI002E09FDFB|nr:hypothetical protein [Actinophytocola sp.]